MFLAHDRIVANEWNDIIHIVTIMQRLWLVVRGQINDQLSEEFKRNFSSGITSISELCFWRLALGSDIVHHCGHDISLFRANRIECSRTPSASASSIQFNSFICAFGLFQVLYLPFSLFSSLELSPSLSLSLCFHLSLSRFITLCFTHAHSQRGTRWTNSLRDSSTLLLLLTAVIAMRSIINYSISLRSMKWFLWFFFFFIFFFLSILFCFARSMLFRAFERNS